MQLFITDYINLSLFLLFNDLIYRLHVKYGVIYSLLYICKYIYLVSSRNGGENKGYNSVLLDFVHAFLKIKHQCYFNK